MRPAILPYGVRVLYISYDGILEPLGDSQVVSYLERLAAEHGITILSFEKPQDLADHSRVALMTRRLEAKKINWIRLRYHKRPRVLSTVYDVWRGMMRARKAARKSDFQIVHARSYVSALIGLAAGRASGALFLFDMRGFWVDEKVEAGHWKAKSRLYRIGKWWERRFFASADAIVSLTEEGVRAFPQIGVRPRPNTRVEVIPTCVDLKRFAPGPKDPELLSSLGLADATVIGCVGTMGNWYMRTEMLQYLAHLTRSLERVKILIVTRDDHAELGRDAEAAGIPPDRLAITKAPFTDMPRHMRLFEAGVFFIKPTLSKRGSAATKLAEFLATGIPLVINAGVGDSGAIVTEGNVGVVLETLDAESFDRSLPLLEAALADPAMADRCRALAAERFDVDRAAERYGQLYREMVGTSLRR